MGAQEAMYQPLGLECGHKFCADCAFSSVGKGNALGTVRAILDHVEPSAACPECRTAGVFVSAMELKTTEKLIRQRRARMLEIPSRAAPVVASPGAAGSESSYLRASPPQLRATG